MLVRVYNQNGKVKITKTSGYVEQTMCSDLPNGEVMEVEIGSSLWTKSHKKKIGAQEIDMSTPTQVIESSLDGLGKSIRTLEFAIANEIIDREEGMQAIAVLKNSVYGTSCGK